MLLMPTALDNLSPAQILAELNEYERNAFLSSLSNEEALALQYDWNFWGRPNQHAPEGDWFLWLILAGRGFGKTRAGAEWINAKAKTVPNQRLAIIGETAAEVRDVMVEGISGILACAPPWFMPKYEPSKRRVTWPNGAWATTYSGDSPEQLRGPGPTHAWCDEFGKWRYPAESWNNLEFMMREGRLPQVCMTTTGRRVKKLKELIADHETVITRGSTRDNFSNLAPRFIDRVFRLFEGTRLGRQELEGDIIDDNPNALWKLEWIDNTRVSTHPDLVSVVVGVDPPGSTSTECGIVVAGIDSSGHGYVIDDMSMLGTPAEWGMQVVSAYFKHKADLVICESNFGGDMVLSTVDTAAQKERIRVPVRKIHASRGKFIRAQPVSMLYEQQHVSHVGSFAKLEDEYCEWTPFLDDADDENTYSASPRKSQPSPNRLDAAVWALTHLMVTDQSMKEAFVIS